MNSACDVNVFKLDLISVVDGLTIPDLYLFVQRNVVAKLKLMVYEIEIHSRIIRVMFFNSHISVYASISLKLTIHIKSVNISLVLKNF